MALLLQDTIQSLMFDRRWGMLHVFFIYSIILLSV